MHCEMITIKLIHHLTQLPFSSFSCGKNTLLCKFEVYNVVLSTVDTKLCVLPPNFIFHHWNVVLFNHMSSLPYPPAPKTTVVRSAVMSLPVLDSTCKIMKCRSFCVKLTSLSIVSFRFMHIVASSRMFLSHGWILFRFVCMYMCV